MPAMSIWKGNDNRAIAILRVSSHGQRDNTSHDVQETEVREYCRLNGLDLIQAFKLVESARHSENRTRYKQARDWALKEGVRHILFYMMDRESRNLTDNEENENLVRRDQFA